MVMPLAVLANRLTLAPPSISALVNLIQHSETMVVFLELVREYVPDHEREIMAGNSWERTEAFKRRFEERYFPLADFAFEEEEALECLISAIPVTLAGWTYEHYHDFDEYGGGQTLLLSLVIYPWVTYHQEDRAARIPVLEVCKSLVGPELVARIPEEGWGPKFLRQACDDTRFAGVADFAEWLCGCTDLWVLDASYENYGEEMWSREVVDELTRQYPLVRQAMDRVRSMMDWLEDSPQENFAKVLDHLLGKAANQVPEEQLPLQEER